jgi:hypothetical protein
MNEQTSARLWAYGIIAALLSFMTFTVMMVWGTSDTNVDLVYEDYYERTIGYDEHIARRDRGQTEGYRIQWAINEAKDSLMLAFPAGDVAGSVEFYRPNDRKQDRRFELPTDAVALGGLASGRWLLRIEWSLDGVPVYSEIPIWL